MLNRSEISGKNIRYSKLFTAQLAFSQIHHLQDTRRIKSNPLRQCLHSLTLSNRRILTEHHKRMAEKSSE